MDELFGFQMKSKMKCIECDEEEPQLQDDLQRVMICHLGTQTDPVSHIHQGIQLSMKEHIEKTSPVLGRNAQYEKSSEVASLPPYLVVQFARFGYKGANDWAGTAAAKVKLIRKCAFSPTLDMTDMATDELKKMIAEGRRKKKELDDDKLEKEKQAMLANEGKGAQTEDIEMKPVEEKEDLEVVPDGFDEFITGYYDLISIVSHKGRTADGGHYVGWSRYRQADGKDLKEDKWVLFDDEDVSFTSWKDMCGFQTDLQGGKADTQIAYINIYKKQVVRVPKGGKGETLGSASASAEAKSAEASASEPKPMDES
jgi:ubiquitin carboxyl-terminal hydrolase 14